MFQIKICGITNIQDAEYAAGAGADAVGLNFYTKSKRYVNMDSAKEIARSVSGQVAIVGLFVNSSAELIQQVAEHVKLDWIQLHGDESPGLVGELDRPVLRAFRCGSDVSHVERHLAAAAQLRCLPEAVLVDAHREGAYGGTGQLVDSEIVARVRQLTDSLPLILAGGLTPQNVGSAITACHPDGVDVASGVETTPGSKDTDMMRRFVQRAREALATPGA